MLELPQKENNNIIFFAHLPKLYEEGTKREHIMLKLTDSHPNNIFLYKDAHILTFSHKMTYSCMLC